MKKQLLLLLFSISLIVGCSKNEGGEGDPFIPPVQGELEQKTYADKENTGNGFSFTANTAWTATVTELQGQSAATVKSDTKVVQEGNNVVWLRLYNGDKESYSGSAGKVTLRIELDQNYTGERREATITITSGGNTFTVHVVQEGTKQDGSNNDAPIPVTEIVFSKDKFSIDEGTDSTLTANVLPENATIKSVVWTSSNPQVLTIHPVTGQIKAIAEGTAIITATSSSNKSVFATCEATVTSEFSESNPVYEGILKEMHIDFGGDNKFDIYIIGGERIRAISEAYLEDFVSNFEDGRVTVSYTLSSDHIPGGEWTYKRTEVYMLENGRAVSGTFIENNLAGEQIGSGDLTFTYEDGYLVNSVEKGEYIRQFRGGPRYEYSETITNTSTWKNGNMIQNLYSVYTHYSDPNMKDHHYRFQTDYKYEDQSALNNYKNTNPISVIENGEICRVLDIAGGRSKLLPTYIKGQVYDYVELDGSFKPGNSYTENSITYSVDKYDYVIGGSTYEQEWVRSDENSEYEVDEAETRNGILEFVYR